MIRKVVISLFFCITVSVICNNASVSNSDTLINELQDTKSDVRLAAAEKLGDLRDKKAARQLQMLLVDPVPEIRAMAAWALGEIGDPLSMTPLQFLLKDKKHSVQERALRALEKIGWQPKEKSIKALCLIIDGKWAKVIALGEPAFDPLLHSLESADIGIRKESCWCLGELKYGAGLKILQRLLADPNWIVRREAVITLSKIGSRQVFPALIQWAQKEQNQQVLLSLIDYADNWGKTNAVSCLNSFTNHPDPLVRREAQEKLMQSGLMPDDKTEKARILINAGKWKEAAGMGEKAVPLLLVALEDKEDEIRVHAAVALGIIKDFRSVAPLLQHLADSLDAREKAMQSLSLFRDKRMPDVLIKELNNPQVMIRQGVAELLANFPGSENSKVLWKLVQDDPSEFVRCSAAMALASYGDRRVASILVSFLDKKHDAQRISELLVRLHASEAIPLLVNMVRDRDEEKRKTAGRVLGQLKAKEATPVLLASIQEENGKDSSWAFWALREISDPLAVKPLLELLAKEKNADVLGQIVITLEELKDKRATEPLLDLLLNMNIQRNFQVLAYVQRALIAFNDPVACRRLTPRIFDMKADYYFVSVLAELDCDNFLGKVIKFAKHPDRRMRERMVGVLGSLRKPECIVPLIHALQDPDEDIRGSAGMSLRSFCDMIHDRWQSKEKVKKALKAGFAALAGKKEVKILIGAALKEKEINRRQGVIAALGETGDARGTDPLISLFADRDPQVWEEAVKALGSIKSPRAVDALIEILSDIHSTIKHEAALSLGRVGDPRGIPPLIEAFRDKHVPDPEVAEQRLATRVDPEQSAFIMYGFRAANENFKPNVVKALGEFSDPRVLPVLQEALQSPDVMIKCEAVRALSKREGKAFVPSLLKILGDRDVHSWLHNAAKDSLTMIAGCDLGYDAEAWKKWWSKEREK